MQIITTLLLIVLAGAAIGLAVSAPSPSTIGSAAVCVLLAVYAMTLGLPRGRR